MINLFFVIHVASIFKGVLGLGHELSQIPRCAAVVLLNLHVGVDGCTCKALRMGPQIILLVRLLALLNHRSLYS